MIREFWYRQGGSSVQLRSEQQHGRVKSFRLCIALTQLHALLDGTNDQTKVGRLRNLEQGSTTRRLVVRLIRTLGAPKLLPRWWQRDEYGRLRSRVSHTATAGSVAIVALIELVKHTRRTFMIYNGAPRLSGYVHMIKSKVEDTGVAAGAPM